MILPRSARRPSVADLPDTVYRFNRQYPYDAREAGSATGARARGGGASLGRRERRGDEPVRSGRSIPCKRGEGIVAYAQMQRALGQRMCAGPELRNRGIAPQMGGNEIISDFDRVAICVCWDPSPNATFDASPDRWRDSQRAQSDADPRRENESLRSGAASALAAPRSNRRGVRRPFGSGRQRRLRVRQFQVRRRGQRQMIGGLSGERRVVNGEIADQAARPAEDAIQREDRPPRRETQD